MNNIRKNIYRLKLEDVPPSTPHLGLQFEDSVLCFGSASIRVFTDIPVKVNMTSFFDTGAFYHLDTGYETADIVDEVVSGMTIYLFGIEASNGGILSYNSRIEFTINDFTTGAVLDSYTLYRTHDGSPC